MTGEMTFEPCRSVPDITRLAKEELEPEQLRRGFRQVASAMARRTGPWGSMTRPWITVRLRRHDLGIAPPMTNW